MNRPGNPENDSYQKALDALFDIHQAKTKEAIQASAARRKKTVEDMQFYLKRLHLPTSTVPILHITGTKGKGSTACIAEAILREHYGMTTGLYTSPHLIDIRERIRINGKPVSKSTFATAYWEVRRRLEGTSSETAADIPTIPGYFRMLTLMALFIFAYYGEDDGKAVQVIILEVGMGGRYDATNLLDVTNGRTVIAGVTQLDFDHTRILGNTLEQIAYEKGGIFQRIKGSTTSSSSSKLVNAPPRLFALGTNTPSVLNVLRDCARNEAGEDLIVLGGPDPDQAFALPETLRLGLAGPHQRLNAELANAMCQALVDQEGLVTTNKEESLYRALENVSWPGRCQSIPIANGHLRLDGAHTLQSLGVGVSWFASCCRTGAKRVLLFNCSHERDPVELLQVLARGVALDRIFFCRSDTERPSSVAKPEVSELLKEHGIAVQPELLVEASPTDATRQPSWQSTLASVWRHVENKDSGAAELEWDVSATEALGTIESLFSDQPVEVCVTGSLYLVGSVLSAVNWSEDAAPGELQIGKDARTG